MKKAFCVSLIIIAAVMFPLFAQYRQVDQGRGGTSSANYWTFKVTDSTGTRFASLETTGTPGVFALVVSGGAAAAGTTAVSVTSGTIGLITMPALTVTSATVGSMPALSVTNSQTIGLITMPSLTFTSGTVGQMPVLNIGTFGPTVTVTGTVQNNGGTVTATPTGTTTVAGTLTGVTGTFTANPAGTTTVTGTVQGNAGTGTLAVNKAQINGAALTTANPDIGGGRTSTDIPSAAANGAVIAIRLDKFGDTITQLAPVDLLGVGTTSVTATTTAQILAASGANTKWAITSIMACNLSGTVATILNVTDSSGTLFSFPWTQTATTAGESRCYMQQFQTPYLSAVNSAITVQLTVSDATGVRTNITAFKTGT